MVTREIIVEDRAISSEGDVSLVRSSVGMDEMHVRFKDPEWLEFGSVEAVFSNRNRAIKVGLDIRRMDSPAWAAESNCTIPWEVLEETGTIALAFQGIDYGNGKRLTTVLAKKVFRVVDSGVTEPSELPSENPTPQPMPKAGEGSLGAVKPDGTTTIVDEDGTISVNLDGYITVDKIGNGLQVDSNGMLSLAIEDGDEVGY